MRFRYAAGALGLLLPLVAHANVITGELTGTVFSGTDNIGLFGTAGADLSGLSVTLDFSWDTGSSSNYSYLNADQLETYTWGQGAGVSDSVTINGQTSSYSSNDGLSQVELQNQTGSTPTVLRITTNTAFGVNQLQNSYINIFSAGTSASGDLADQTAINALLANLQAPTPYGIITLVASGAPPTATDGLLITFNSASFATPEPSTLLLAGAALCGLGFARRRRMLQ